jgi:hypothetical protein
VKGNATHAGRWAAIGLVTLAAWLAAPAGSTAGDTAPVTKRVAVVLFNFSDDMSQPFTADDAYRAVFTDPDSPAAYFRAVSGGALELTGTIFGWVTIDAAGAGCSAETATTSDRQWNAAARVQLVAAGADIRDFDYVLYGMPAVSCGASGRARVVCSGARCDRLAFVYSPASFLGHHTPTHELGHLIGSAHANRYDCTDAQGRPAAIGPSCTKVEYGDPFVVMGSGGGELDAYRRASLGWLAPPEVQTVTQDGVYTLAPIEQPGGVRALKVPHERDAAGAVTSYYWLEFRRPLGFDSFLAALSTARQDGLQIRVAPGEEKRGAYSYLIDTTPDTTGKRDQPLAPGRAFYDAAGALLVENLGVAGGTLRVRIRLALPADTTPPPPPARVWDGPGARDSERAETTAQNELYLSWSPVRDEPAGTGLAVYEYCIGTRVSAQGCAGTIVGSWQPATASPADFMTGPIALHAGRRYFGCVRGRDNAGNVSRPRCSNGQVR